MEVRKGSNHQRITKDRKQNPENKAKFVKDMNLSPTRSDKMSNN